jgi:hypothetical protein
MLVAAGLLLMYSSPVADGVGLGLAGVVVAAQLWKRRRLRQDGGPAPRAV